MGGRLMVLVLLLVVASRDGWLSDGHILETNKHPIFRKKKHKEHKHSHRICACYRIGRPYPNRLFIAATYTNTFLDGHVTIGQQPVGRSERARTIRLNGVRVCLCVLVYRCSDIPFDISIACWSRES